MVKINIGSVRSIYLYAVSFATLMVLIFSIASAAQEAISLAYPDAGYYPGPLDIRLRARAELEQDSEISEDIIREQVEHERMQARQNTRHQQARRLAKDIALIAVTLPAYLYHWRKAQNESAEG